MPGTQTQEDEEPNVKDEQDMAYLLKAKQLFKK
jgi:hypothetical protein